MRKIADLNIITNLKCDEKVLDGTLEKVKARLNEDLLHPKELAEALLERAKAQPDPKLWARLEPIFADVLGNQEKINAIDQAGCRDQCATILLEIAKKQPERWTDWSGLLDTVRGRLEGEDKRKWIDDKRAEICRTHAQSALQQVEERPGNWAELGPELDKILNRDEFRALLDEKTSIRADYAKELLRHYTKQFEHPDAPAPFKDQFEVAVEIKKHDRRQPLAYLWLAEALLNAPSDKRQALNNASTALMDAQSLLGKNVELKLYADYLKASMEEKDKADQRPELETMERLLEHVEQANKIAWAGFLKVKARGAILARLLAKAAIALRLEDTGRSFPDCMTNPFDTPDNLRKVRKFVNAAEFVGAAHKIWQSCGSGSPQTFGARA